MKRLVVGTAGHIDHGKTSLVKALTGVDTDRLSEEKARGITIELGFAPFELPGGQHLAFVDVPGHERLVRTMIAGASGIDVVLLVIAADEGVMPQTREHLDILRFLGIKHGAVVLTKVDLVDEELLELAEDDVREFVAGTFLDGAPVVPCSAETGAGLNELREVLRTFGEQLEARATDGFFRLPIDRVFSLRGFGTVITGTLVSGKVAVGESVAVYPAGFTAKVRGLQVHGHDVNLAQAGQRTAVNLQGIDKDRLARGDQLSAPGELLTTSLLDVAYEHLAVNAGGLTHRSRIRFLSGTTEVDGVAHVLGGDEVLPGERGFLQLRLDNPVAARAGDRYVLRLESPVVTLGGGEIVDPAPSKHRRRGRAEAAQLLERLASEALEAQCLTWLIMAGPGGAHIRELARRSGHSVARLGEIFTSDAHQGEVVALDSEGNEFVARHWIRTCKASVLEKLDSYHQKNPLKLGAPRGELRGGVRFCGERVFMRVLDEAIGEGAVLTEGPLYRRAGFEVQLDERNAHLAAALEKEMEAAGLAVPLISELKDKLGEEQGRLLDVLNYLTAVGKLTKVKEGYWVPTSSLQALQGNLVEHIKARGELRPADFKDMTGLSRKWAIPLLEYFDKIQLTLRVGDVRVLRNRG